MSEDETTPQETEIQIDVDVAPVEETPDRSLAEAVRARALEVNSATRDLVNSKEAFTHDGIHDIRVATKRLRALWQLVRPVIEPQIARTADQRLREIAHSVAGARDADVARDLLADLRDADDRGGRRDHEGLAGRRYLEDGPRLGELLNRYATS